MLELVIKVSVSYLLGSVIGSLLIARLAGGGDIRSEGSGNAGGTNALRTRGWKFALPVVLIDAGKGVLAVLLIAPLAIPFVPEAAFRPEWIAVACGIAAVVGHVWPVWHGFRGGKGMATYLGALGVLAWPALVVGILVWLVVLLLTGYVGLSTIIAAFAVAAYCLLITGLSPLFVFGIVMAGFILYTHRSNLARLRDGTEHRFEKAMIFRRLLGD
ncbi:MAG: glycerol-3-phosphate 1-O-acyltransferase PlsY [Proteobacteria bacterium]|nr:glycerol-3-phosphate 1-O-acyltransferase PlsY [Pseudomonadota bacterium]